MKVYILMTNCGDPYEPDIQIFNVYSDKSVALANKLDLEDKYNFENIWIEEWEVE